jgi:formimidoylglutamate deiminase
LEVGRGADFFTVDLDDPSVAGAGDALLNHVVFSLERTAVRDVAVGGEFVVRDGHHALEEEIIGQFAGVQRDVWGAV